MASLYDDGWRQGAVFDETLPMDAVVLDAVSLRPTRSEGTNDRWVIATQDCDLDLTETTSVDPAIEVRPVFIEDPPDDWGIRSARFRLTEEEYVRSTSPRSMVSAEVLTRFRGLGVPVRQLDENRRQAFITWLGKRYDRPAVPPEYLPLTREIAEKIIIKRNRPTGMLVRDVLIQFEDGNPARCSLFAVLVNPGDEHAVREWLSGIALDISPELGVVDQIEAAPASGISLELIETSYSADVSQLTWRPNNPIPQGS